MPIRKAMADETASIRKPPAVALTRRVSRDGYEEWVDEKSLPSRSRLPPILRKRADRPGRKWDHLRTAEPVIMGTGYRPPGEDPYAKWRDFIRSTSYPHVGTSTRISPDDLEALTHLAQNVPFHHNLPSQHFVSKNHDIRYLLLRHSITPLIFRLIVLTTTITALALSAKEVDENADGKSIFSVVIDAVAIPYISYMTYDEYSGSPIGLRPAAQKVGLIMLDLFFIILKASYTALGFDHLSQPGVKHDDGLSRHLARSLAVVTLIGLLAWICNFALSVFRVVEKMGGLHADR